jgi:hypothetical protein
VPIGKKGRFVAILRRQDVVTATLEDFLESLARAGVFFKKEDRCLTFRRTAQRLQF